MPSTRQLYIRGDARAAEKGTGDVSLNDLVSGCLPQLHKGVLTHLFLQLGRPVLVELDSSRQLPLPLSAVRQLPRSQAKGHPPLFARSSKASVHARGTLEHH
jgi:hypothetical protein